MKEIDIRYNENNEVVKHRYFEQLENKGDGRDPATVKQHINAIHLFEVANTFQDFKKYRSDWAIIFKNHLNDKLNVRTGEHISKSMFFNYLNYVRRFLEWLRENESGYSKLKLSEIDYLNAKRKEKNQAKATDYPISHKIVDIISTIRNMPEETEMEMRDKALMSLLLLTTPRIKSLQDARLKSIHYFEDYDAWAFMQDPRTQNTKYSKYITSFFVGQAQDLIENVLKWKAHLVAKGFKNKNYLFPKIQAPFAKGGGNLRIITREPINSDSLIRNIVRKAFENNNMQYIKPHNFRHSMIRHVEKIAKGDIMLRAALDENVGHKNGFSETYRTYAGNPDSVKAQLMKSISLE